MSGKHDEVAKRIAKKQGTTYNRSQGPDVENSQRAIEVETTGTVGDAARQLAGYQKPVYVAGADAKVTKKALQHYKNTTIGVKNSQGNVVKPSTRGRMARRAKGPGPRTKGTGARRTRGTGARKC